MSAIEITPQTEKLGPFVVNLVRAFNALSDLFDVQTAQVKVLTDMLDEVRAENEALRATLKAKNAA